MKHSQRPVEWIAVVIILEFMSSYCQILEKIEGGRLWLG